jgi:hypothetical protein
LPLIIERIQIKVSAQYFMVIPGVQRLYALQNRAIHKGNALQIYHIFSVFFQFLTENIAACHYEECFLRQKLRTGFVTKQSPLLSREIASAKNASQ